MWTTNIHTGIKQQTTLLYYKITTELCLMTNKLAMKIEKHYIRKKTNAFPCLCFWFQMVMALFTGNSYDNKSWYSTLLPMKTWNLSKTPDSKSKLFSSLDPQTQKSFTWEFDSRSIRGVSNVFIWKTSSENHSHDPNPPNKLSAELSAQWIHLKFLRESNPK